MHALGPALERRGAAGKGTHDPVADREVVLDDVELGHRAGRSVAGKITRSGLETRTSRAPASTVVAWLAAMPWSSTGGPDHHQITGARREVADHGPFGFQREGSAQESFSTDGVMAASRCCWSTPEARCGPGATLARGRSPRASMRPTRIHWRRHGASSRRSWGRAVPAGKSSGPGRDPPEVRQACASVCPGGRSRSERWSSATPASSSGRRTRER